MKQYTEDELDQALFFDVYNIAIPGKFLKFINKITSNIDLEIRKRKVFEGSSGLRRGDYIPTSISEDIAIDALFNRERILFRKEKGEVIFENEGRVKVPYQIAGGPVHPSDFVVVIEPPLLSYGGPRTVIGHREVIADYVGFDGEPKRKRNISRIKSDAFLWGN